MRGLYEIFIVDPELGEVLGKHELIAKSGSSAKIKALAMQGLDIDIDVDDLDVVVVMLGDVRDKKVVQEVKILKD